MPTAVTDPPVAAKSNHEFDPDQYRMTIGDHLEELRARIFMALLGYVIVLAFCFWHGKQVVTTFCAPMVKVLLKHGISPRLVTDEVGEGFMVFIKISMISAAALGAPWILYQLWKFIAAGLFPHERKYVSRYMPLSIGLLISGMAFLYFMVLPWTLDFLIGFSTSVDLPTWIHPAGTVTVGPDVVLPKAPVLPGDPEKGSLAEGQFWINSASGQFMMMIGGQPRQIPFNSNNLLAPEIKLETYIDLVVTMLVVFGLSFQLPLIVLALERVGITSIAQLKEIRRYVYFTLAIIAAIVTPGGDIPTMLMLTIPLIGLYEMGIWLAKFGRGRRGAVA